MKARKLGVAVALGIGTLWCQAALGQQWVTNAGGFNWLAPTGGFPTVFNASVGTSASNFATLPPYWRKCSAGAAARSLTATWASPPEARTSAG